MTNREVILGMLPEKWDSDGWDWKQAPGANRVIEEAADSLEKRVVTEKDIVAWYEKLTQGRESMNVNELLNALPAEYLMLKRVKK